MNARWASFAVGGYVRRIIQAGGFQKNGEVRKGANALQVPNGMKGLQLSGLGIPACDDAGSEEVGFI